MKNALIVFLLLGIALGSQAQMRYNITSEPDSATVTLNGELVGHTPCEIRKFWNGADLNFSVEKAGFAPELTTISEKPDFFYGNVRVNLVRIYPFKVDSNSALIAFDKVVAGFAPGKVLGHKDEFGYREEIKWEGNMKVGDKTFDAKTYKTLDDAGFQVAELPSTELFSDSKLKRRLPRFILGAKIKDVQIEVYVDKSAPKLQSRVSTVKVEVEWQVMDKAIKKVAHTATTVGIYTKRSYEQYSSDTFLTAYEFSLYEFLKDGKFAALVNEAMSKEGLKPEMEDTLQAKIEIPSIVTPTFENNAAMIQAATPTCVTISTDAGHGSGVLVSQSGHVLTAYHVIDGVNQIEVILSNGMHLDGQLLAYDEEYDIALLKIPGSGYRALSVGNSELSGLGTEVFTIGTPTDVELGQSVSKGIVSGKRKVEGILYLQTDVAVSPGNSGGPLLNTEGAIIGIVQRKLIGQGIEGVGFALPIETVLKTLGIALK